MHLPDVLSKMFYIARNTFFQFMHCLEIKIMTLALRMQCSAEFLYYENLLFGSVRFFMFLKKSISPRQHLFDQNHCKIHNTIKNIVKYDYNLK